MKLTNKGRYAVMAMADLASNAKEGPISLTEILLVKYIFCSFSVVRAALFSDANLLESERQNNKCFTNNPSGDVTAKLFVVVVSASLSVLELFEC